MSLGRELARVAMAVVDEAHACALLRRATSVGSGVRVFGHPSIVNEGDLRIGARVVLMSTPAAITLVAERGGSITIGDNAVLESGVTIRARRRIVIGASARIGVGCLLDDADSDGVELGVDYGAWLADGAIVDGSASLRASSRAGDASDTDATSERVRAVIADIVPGMSSIGSREDVQSLAAWDSLAALRVVVALERELGVQLPFDLFAAPRTLDSVVAVVRSVCQ